MGNKVISRKSHLKMSREAKIVQQEEIKRQAEIGREHVIALILGLLGVIQGLAFTHLADKMAKSSVISALIEAEHVGLDSFITIMYYMLCFAIVARVFQTYASAAVSYSRSYLHLFELYAIFLAGLLQYYIFESISENGTVNAEKLFFRVMILGGLAIIMHIATALKESGQNYSIKTQVVNIGLSGLIVILCAVARFVNIGFVQNQYFEVSAAALVCASLVTMTWNSLRNTNFGSPPEVLDHPHGASGGSTGPEEPPPLTEPEASGTAPIQGEFADLAPPTLHGRWLVLAAATGFVAGVTLFRTRMLPNRRSQSGTRRV